MADYFLPNIDLELLKAEKAGLAIPPKNRHASEAQRNANAANDKVRAHEVPTVVHSLEQHWTDKGFTKGAISEKFLDLAKHEQEKPKTVVAYACGVFWPVEGRNWEQEYLAYLDGIGI